MLRFEINGSSPNRRKLARFYESPSTLLKPDRQRSTGTETATNISQTACACLFIPESNQIKYSHDFDNMHYGSE